ncbi:MAG: hypothetical protein H5U34_09940, partial [Klebsiella pneumoniae]|nr:hypothetical protein [Klebsiella pneumoniae]
MVSNNSERSGEYLLEMSNINKSFPGVNGDFAFPNLRSGIGLLSVEVV